jgi:sugar phosphate isomerase/epimerase
MPDRRHFLRQVSRLSAGLAAAGLLPRGTEAELSGAWGVQLYTLRNLLPTKPAETLKAVAALGYREVEMLRPGLETLTPLAREAGLAVPALHIEAPIVTGEWAAWKSAPGASAFLPAESYGIDSAIADAKKHGVRFLTVPYLLPTERTSLDFYRRFADSMNRAGEKCAAAGLHLCYHHHSFEFEPLEGKVPMDLLAERFDPRSVGFELDVFWLSVAGRDPATAIRDLGARVRLLHLKDKAEGTPNEFLERSVKPAAFAEVGGGALDFPGILKAARAVGVAHAFVEQDQTPGDPMDSLRKSYAYLSSLRVSKAELESRIRPL